MDKETSPPQLKELRFGLQIAVGRDQCSCGIAWVRLGEVYPTVDFPNRLENASLCPTSYVVELEMGVLRCAPAGEATAAASTSEWAQFSADVAEDEEAMREALCCLISVLSLERGSYLDRGSTPLETEGGCGGRVRNIVVEAFCIGC